MKALDVLRRVDPWPVLAAFALSLCGIVFIGSATSDDVRFGEQQTRQLLFLCCGAGLGLFAVLPHYVRYLRGAWVLYGVSVLALAGLFVLAPEINGSRRWYPLPGFSVQPSEFAKLGVVLALAALLRFKHRARAFETLVVPMVVVAVPALLILREPDLGSALVLGPVLLAMCFAAGAPRRSVLAVLLVSSVVAVVAYLHLLHDYQHDRIEVWLKHWAGPLSKTDKVNAGYQPWQALIALGGGGLFGYGIGEGPQNTYDFLPYRSEDYMFAVIGEETGFVGAVVVLLLVGLLTLSLLNIAMRTRERFGRLVCVGVATWLGGQSLMHVAVCGWLVPSTGLPMPFVSYGGSSGLACMLAVALCANISARREPILGGDGFL